MKSVIIVNDTRSQHHVGCDAVMNNLFKICDELDYKVVYSHPVSMPWQDNEDFNNAFEKSDYIIVNGEGSIHHSNFRAHMLTSLAPYARSKGKKIVLLNSTLYENDDEIFDNLTHFNSVWCRDRASLKTCRDRNIKCKFAPDLSFYNHEFVDRQPNKKKFFMVTDSVINEDTERLAQLSEKYLHRYVPIKHERGLKHYLKSIRASSGVITGRYHAVCLAIANLRPFAAIASNTPKIEYILDDIFKNTDRLISAENINEAVVKPYSENEIKKIKAYISASKERYAKMKLDLVKTFS